MPQPWAEVCDGSLVVASYLHDGAVAGFCLKILLQKRSARARIAFRAAFEQQAVFLFFVHGPAMQQPVFYGDGKTGMRMRKVTLKNGAGHVAVDKGSKKHAFFLAEAVVKFFLQCQLNMYLPQPQNVQKV